MRRPTILSLLFIALSFCNVIAAEWTALFDGSPNSFLGTDEA
jgi:hypothetical protein